MAEKQKYTVSGDLYYEIHGKSLEIFRQLRQKGGCPTDPRKIALILQKVIEPAKCDELLSPEELQKLLPFADEEVKSNLGYPDGFRIRTPEEQLKVWEKHFPKLNRGHVLELAGKPLSDSAEGWAVIPKPSKIGKTYHQALDKMLKLIAQSRKFQNWREGELGPEYVRLVEKTKQILNKLEKETMGDFLVFPFQFGLRWACSKSMRWVRTYFSDNEFGLGPYEVAALLATHPDRITASGQLYIDCAGSEYSPSVGGLLQGRLYFYWGDVGKCLGLNYRRHGDGGSDLGAVSGFRL
ncbi:hypothetical protein KJ969_00060 [Patescibacteria group bacterium]|nr:hypothetical protein [Patescibacteria group bacterium]MBU1921868.1 hypothetical protein [Patescibacteria group bacterium]